MMSEQASGRGNRRSVALTTGDFIAFNSAYGLFLGAMQALGDASLNLLRIVPIYERLKPMLTTPPEVDGSKAFPGKLTGEIELSHVNFRYDEDGPWILRNVCSEDQGRRIRRLRRRIRLRQVDADAPDARLRKAPRSGTLYYDGQDLASLDLRMVRQQMGVVLQVSRRDADGNLSQHHRRHLAHDRGRLAGGEMGGPRRRHPSHADGHAHLRARKAAARSRAASASA